MIKSIDIRGFTLFESAKLQFAPGINVIIGSNGTGKSHLLKICYTAARWSQEMALRTAKQGRPDKATMQKELGGKLVRVFRPDQLGRLTSRIPGRKRAEVAIAFAKQPKAGFKFGFATNSSTDVAIDKVPDEFTAGSSIFFPTKEMLSMFPGFIALYERVSIEIDETYADLCRALESPLLRGPRLRDIDNLLAPMEALLGGTIRNENGRFYLVQKGSGKFEISLVAEGFRKLGAVAYLLANGSLTNQSVLFWDEPETNLNPAYIRKVAEMLVKIAASGTQVFVATHSLFLLREISMLTAEGSSRFFALSEKSANLAAEWDRRATVISQGDSAEEIEPIAALEAEMEQNERYLATAP
jgi:energy-coupling factor transporter ATP-binding protein EcfA2